MLRWFTPTFEIDLCGHATLATTIRIKPSPLHLAHYLYMIEPKTLLKDAIATLAILIGEPKTIKF
ncbi:MAG: PhzF family phenazine biosynthesis protein [Desulfosporosinus sp.]|nr:PhzF family phenazine biosynthesis protein [Desulfosporosinus sp.]